MKMDQVIEKLAEKIAAVAEKIQPLAEEIVRQYQVQAIVAAIMYGIGGMICIALGVLFDTAAKKEKDENKQVVFGFIVLFFFFFAFIFSVLCGSSILEAVGPLPSILGL